jgi:hypothetical protein
MRHTPQPGTVGLVAENYDVMANAIRVGEHLLSRMA